MPLDPMVKGFLDQMAAVPGPKMSEAGAQVARETFVGLMQLVGPKDVPVGKTENLTVPGPGGPIPIRVYTPVAAGRDPMPALIYYHGGGWVIGNIETHDGLCRMMANEGGFRVHLGRLSPCTRKQISGSDRRCIRRAELGRHQRGEYRCRRQSHCRWRQLRRWRAGRRSRADGQSEGRPYARVPDAAVPGDTDRGDDRVSARSCRRLFPRKGDARLVLRTPICRPMRTSPIRRSRRCARKTFPAFRPPM